MSARYEDFSALNIVLDEDGILHVGFDNPGKLNALSAQQHRAIADIWPVIDHDPDVKVVLLFGCDGVFSAGGELEMLENMIDDSAYRATIYREARDLVHNIVNFSKPIVSAIEGVAVGAGLAAALLADISVAGENAKIVDGHTKIGVAAGDHAAIIWPLLCGMAKAKYYLLTCETLTGAEAERIGIVSCVAPDTEVLATAVDIAQRCARGSQSALSWTKWSLNGWLRQAAPIFDASLAAEFLGFTQPDAAVGVAAVREKALPKFT